MKYKRFIVLLKRNTKNLLQAFLLLASAWFIYQIWTEPTADSKAEKLIITQIVIIANIIFEIQKTANI